MRGRRRPAGLTERERGVLALVRLGLTNEEIAGRLGITLDGAKYHVSQILQKLGVASREEAAALPEEVAFPWWARALAWSVAAKAAVVAVALAIALGLGVMAWAVLATGGGDSASPLVQASATPSGPTPVPWVDSTIGPTPSPSPYPSANPSDLGVRACQGGDLTAEFTHGAGAAGNNLAYWTFTNVSATACRLEGVPDLTFRDADGNALPGVIAKVPCLWESDVECAATVAAIMSPGGSAWVVTNTPNVPPSCPTTTASVVFGLPEGGGDVTVAFVGGDSCMHMSVGRFHPAIAVTPTPMPQPDLSATLELPDSVTAGETLRFTVELSNNGREVFTFGALCPNYVIIVGPKVAGGAHSLNCQLTPEIAPGATITFAMQGDIPATVPGGSYSVDWMLEGTTYLVHAGTAAPIEKTPYTIDVIAASGVVQPSP